MKRLLAAAIVVSGLAGCRSVPIAVPDLPSDQLLINQPVFESAVQQRMFGNCVKGNVQLTLAQAESLSKSIVCDMLKPESGIK